MDTNRITQDLYQQINVWRKVSSEQTICYRVFQRLSDGYYAVQSADFFSLPLEQDKMSSLDQQLAELFLEVDIEEREGFYATIDEAIVAHDMDFGWL